MKQVSAMPTSGQFVAVWDANGSIWSAVYFADGSNFCQYCPSDMAYGDFNEIDDLQSDMKRLNASYYVAD